MGNKKFYAIFAVGVAIIASLIFWGLKQPAKAPTIENNIAAAINANADIILFYGKECPHCQEVEKFLTDNKIADKVQFESAEVWHNTANAGLLAQKAQACNIPKEQQGVPFLWAKGECFIGTPDVENFFKQAAGIQ